MIVFFSGMIPNYIPYCVLKLSLLGLTAQICSRRLWKGYLHYTASREFDFIIYIGHWTKFCCTVAESRRAASVSLYFRAHGGRTTAHSFLYPPNAQSSTEPDNNCTTHPPTISHGGSTLLSDKSDQEHTRSASKTSTNLIRSGPAICRLLLSHQVRCYEDFLPYQSPTKKPLISPKTYDAP